MDIEFPSFGRCCYCDEADANVFHMLPFKIPAASLIQHQGWGCLTCKLPFEGAVSVFCERCAQALESDDVLYEVYCQAPTICLGEDGRQQVNAAELMPHVHDASYHPEVAAMN